MKKKPKASSRVSSAREAALDILIRVEEGQAYSNLVLNRTLEKVKLGRLDAALTTELVYGTIQRVNTIDYFLALFVTRGMHKLDGWVRCLLRMSFYQLYYLDRIPDHAIVNEAVSIAGRRGHRGISGMVNGVLRGVIRRKAELVLPQELDPARRISLQHSHPLWLVKRWIRQFGEQTAEYICESNNHAPHVSIRVNRLRRSPEELRSALEQAGLKVRRSPLAEKGLIIEGGGNMAHHPGYAAGDYSIQDESSMLVADMLAAQPGMRVLDCCAAPGGKSTHIAEMMNDEGDIHAVDIHEHKRQLIENQAQRLGLTSIHTQVADARHLRDIFAPESFDRILIDAPCSGFGIVRRKPDVKWVRKEKDITEIASLQRDIMNAASGLLKPGGLLVYSTCTILNDENQAIVSGFLQNHDDFTSEKTIQILPHQFDSDGFFIARMRKRTSEV